MGVTKSPGKLPIINKEDTLDNRLEKEFVEKLEKNQYIIHNICRAYTQNRDDYKDLFQEISIQLWKTYGKFRGEAKFSTWVYRVALNTAISLYRKKKKYPKTENLDERVSATPDTEYDDTRDRQLKELYQAIHKLNDIEKALVLLYLEDKPYKEIAECLGISEVNARVKMTRTKIKLKKLLNLEP